MDVYGIAVAAFISCKAKQVLKAYLNGIPATDTFYMTGFRDGRRNHFQGGKR